MCIRDRLKSSECIFIDDRLSNVKGAELVGMHGIKFDSSQQLKSELKKYNIEI